MNISAGRQTPLCIPALVDYPRVASVTRGGYWDLNCECIKVLSTTFRIDAVSYMLLVDLKTPSIFKVIGQTRWNKCPELKVIVRDLVMFCTLSTSASRKKIVQVAWELLPVHPPPPRVICVSGNDQCHSASNWDHTPLMTHMLFIVCHTALQSPRVRAKALSCWEEIAPILTGVCERAQEYKYSNTLRRARSLYVC